MAKSHMTLTLDISSLNALCQLYCQALDCAHNTAQRSHGTSIGHCDFKHLCLTSGGNCKSYKPSGEVVTYE